MNLIQHAQLELKLAGLFDKDSDYGGEIGKAVLELVNVFGKQGHSGFSAEWTLEVFNKVASYKNLTPITSDPKYWIEVDKGMWQNARYGSLFSKDGGKTWYDVDAPKKKWYQFWK